MTSRLQKKRQLSGIETQQSDSLLIVDRFSFWSIPPYKDKDFLISNYIDKNLSAKRVAKLTNCSKSSILKYLDELNIPKRESGTCIKKGVCSYGKRYKLGHEIAHKREEQMISYINSLSVEGLSNEKIVKVLIKGDYSTKTKLGKWHRKTIWTILNKH